MRFIFILLLSPFTLLAVPVNNACDTAYQDVSYSYQHTKKALQANNKEQLLYFTDKALEAINRSTNNIQVCGCTEADELNYNVIENLNKGLSKDSYEEIRFYVKRANSHVKNIIIALDSFTADSESETVEEDNSQENDLLAQEQSLLEQQKKLEEQQKNLKKQLAAQQQKKEALAAQKSVKLEEQKKLKTNAEKALQEMENTIQKMSSSLKCVDATASYGTYTKTIQELNAETLDATKGFYAQKAIEMSQHLSNIMKSCK